MEQSLRLSSGSSLLSVRSVGQRQKMTWFSNYGSIKAAAAPRRFYVGFFSSLSFVSGGSRRPNRSLLHILGSIETNDYLLWVITHMQ